MSEYVNIRDQVCPNIFCDMYDQQNGGNIVVHSRQRARLKCNACGKTWAVHCKAVHYGFRSDKTKIALVLEFLNGGGSIRKAAREVQVSPSTVQRWQRRAREMGIFDN